MMSGVAFRSGSIAKQKILLLLLYEFYNRLCKYIFAQNVSYILIIFGGGGVLVFFSYLQM